MGPVAVVVVRVRVVVHEVVAAAIVAGELRVDDVWRVQRVVVDVVDARVDDCDADAGTADAGIVGGLRTDPADAPGVVVLGITGQGGRFDYGLNRAQGRVEFDATDAGFPRELLHLAAREHRRDAVDEGQASPNLAAVPLDCSLGGETRLGVHGDDDLDPLRRRRIRGARRAGRSGQQGRCDQRAQHEDEPRSTYRPPHHDPPSGPDPRGSGCRRYARWAAQTRGIRRRGAHGQRQIVPSPRVSPSTMRFGATNERGPQP